MQHFQLYGQSAGYNSAGYRRRPSPQSLLINFRRSNAYTKDLALAGSISIDRQSTLALVMTPCCLPRRASATHGIRSPAQGAHLLMVSGGQGRSEVDVRVDRQGDQRRDRAIYAFRQSTEEAGASAGVAGELAVGLGAAIDIIDEPLLDERPIIHHCSARRRF